MSPPFDSSDGKTVRQSTQKLVKFTEPEYAKKSLIGSTVII